MSIDTEVITAGDPVCVATDCITEVTVLGGLVCVVTDGTIEITVVVDNCGPRGVGAKEFVGGRVAVMLTVAVAKALHMRCFWE